LLDPVLFRALCDPTRVKLLACLVKCGRPCGVGEVAECCSVDLSVVSRHLRTLEAAGVLASKKAGRTVSYEVRWEPLCGVLRDLADAIARSGPSPRSAACKGACRARR
jgi:ArsR family transcriptional regulator